MIRRSLFIVLSTIFLICPGLCWAQNIKSRQVKETPLAQINFSSQVRRTLTVSPDCRKIAFVALSADKQYVVINGKDQGKYDEILGRPIFSPDSKKVAYVVRMGGEKFVVINGKEEKPYADILCNPVFSPDSGRLAYIAKVGKKEVVVMDGIENGQYYDEICRYKRDGIIIFSPDSRRIVYCAISGDQKFVVVDGTKYKICDGVGIGSWHVDWPVFSPDSSKIAYQARIGMKWFAMIDGVETGKGYDSVFTIVFSPDSKRMGYIARRGAKDVVVVDGMEGQEYDGIDLLTFSPDGKNVAYRAYRYARGGVGGDWFLVLNGQEKKAYKIAGDSFAAYGNLVFSPDSQRFALKTRFGISVSDRDDIHFEKTGYPVFSPDSQKLAFMAGYSDKQFVVINGKQGAVFDSLGSPFYYGNPVFSPDSKRVAYTVRIGKNWTVMIDDMEGPRYDEIIVFPGGEKVFESFDCHPYYDFISLKIQTELAIRGKLVFDSSDRMHYLALKGNTVYLIEEVVIE